MKGTHILKTAFYKTAYDSSLVAILAKAKPCRLLSEMAVMPLIEQVFN